MAINRDQAKGAGAGVSMSAAVVAATLSIVQPWEGVSTRTYKDIVGVPTRCYGETKPAIVNDPRVYTIEDCKKLLAARLPEYYNGWMKCVNEDVRAKVPDSIQSTGTSLAYNVGAGTVCKSNFVKEVNKLHWEEACDALMAYRFAGGKEIKGLVNRRRAEHKICVDGLPEPEDS